MTYLVMYVHELMSLANSIIEYINYFINIEHPLPSRCIFSLQFFSSQPQF